jgi:SAM-dependent methyltransferase
MAGTAELFDRYYFRVPGFVDGTAEFHMLCRQQFQPGSRLLEIGAGPPNATTRFLAGIGPVVGVDVSDEVESNPDLVAASIYDGCRLPFEDGAFEGCVSNYVLEHLAEPSLHFREVSRVLKPGGKYVVRTPNARHYVTIASRLLPHTAHVILAKWTRDQTNEEHDPWMTYYRANSTSRLSRLARDAGLSVSVMTLVEKEPSYGRASLLLFYPMMAYERLVNSSALLARFRSSIVAVFQKMDTRE